jgi:hypothetical protein
LSSKISIVFHSDLVDNEAKGFSIQVVQLTDCTTPVDEIKTLPIRVEDSSCKISLLPDGEINSTEIQMAKDQECAYIINQEEGKKCNRICFLQATRSSSSQVNVIQV